MKYQKILPSKNIQGIVDFFWDFEGDFSTSDIYHHSTTASINPKLAFQYRRGMKIVDGENSKELFTSGFQCQTKSFYNISASQKTGVFGICFKPYAISLLFNIPAWILTNQNIEISTLLGREGEILEDKMLACPHTDARIKLITGFIEDKLKKADNRQDNVVFSIDQILAHKGNINIPALAEEHFLSQRQFERRFKDLAGFSPKTFARIVRFEDCLTKTYNTKYSLTEISLLSGYYDQSHMIKDFKEFTGSIPRDIPFDANAIFV
ncbi:helix-turn-helix domain-containing protein [Pseudochryseolinea flava]|uniref:HTH araC/xylS-type domain-containing protein n=1 Tax=Pseudochryseolinea flava TaxID=2059302 RepID=A0A364Y262_9BACT|nr:helix-turn-helix domain-containing protein [Pseudochryseolinea flava]RAW00747.1 hypothetical protein DQQ10_14305 [Pseudochryseolinea flava]